MACTARGLQLSEGLCSKASLRLGGGGVGAPSPRAGAPCPGDWLPPMSSGDRGCRLPGARGLGWGAEAGAPCARPVHGGDSTSQRLLRLCQTRRRHVSLRVVEEGAFQWAVGGILFILPPLMPRPSSTMNFSSTGPGLLSFHSLTRHSVDILPVRTPRRRELSQAAETQELSSSGGWNFLGFKF